jgi:hypothetical protein
MSWVAIKWARNQHVGSSTAKAVLLTLALYADETGFCWPSQETIAADIETSVDSVQRALKKHLEPALVRRIKRKSADGRRISDAYQLNLGRRSDGGGSGSCGPAPCGPVDVDHRTAANPVTEPQVVDTPSCTVRPKSTMENIYESSGRPLIATAGGKRLEQKLGEAVFHAWFSDVRFIEQRDQFLILAAERRYFADHIEQQFEYKIIDCFRPEYEQALRVKVTVRKNTNPGQGGG